MLSDPLLKLGVAMLLHARVHSDAAQGAVIGIRLEVASRGVLTYLATVGVVISFEVLASNSKSW